MILDVGFAVAERVMYVPSIGYCMLLIALLERLIDGVVEEAPETEAAAKRTKPDMTEIKPNRLRTFGLALAVVAVSLYALRWLSQWVFFF